jgi:hypothetical protein
MKVKSGNEHAMYLDFQINKPLYSLNGGGKVYLGKKS